jgi:cell wall assembly regulator SMI1
VWLLGYHPYQKITLIKLIWAAHCADVSGLKEAKDLVDDVPARISKSCGRRQAEQLRTSLFKDLDGAPGPRPRRWLVICPAGAPWPGGTSVAGSWKRIDRWLAVNAPGWSALAKGASDEEIVQAEQALGFPLPADLRESYRAHDGSKGEAFFPSGLHAVLLSLSDIVEVRKLWVAKGIRREWNVGRVPFTSNGGGDHDCVAQVPASCGLPGQIISVNQETGWHKLRAPSFRNWLHRFAIDLESGVYRYEEDSQSARSQLRSDLW